MEQFWDFLQEKTNDGSIIKLLEFLGTIAFAISGIRLASAKTFDWFGAFVVGFVTAVGGGTMRDLLIGEPVFWLNSSLYIWGTLFAFIVVLLFRKYLVHLNNTIFWFDCIGLGLFTIVGFEKTLMHQHAFWVCVTMATITGIIGGITRDLLINEIPVIFRQELYASACALGGILYTILYKLSVDTIIIQVSVFFLVVVIRYLAVKYHLSLPTLKPES